jgi:glycosyltransferase involved in cell wall biosynthesis
MPTAGASYPVVDARVRIHGVIWNALTGLSLGYALTELLDNLPTDKTEPYLWCLRGDLEAPRPFERVALPSFLFRLLCKAGVSFKLQGRLASEVALRQIFAGDIVYIWPPYDLPLIRRARDRGAIVIAERTNCMAQMCRNVLAPAYARRGLPFPEDIFSREDIAEELEQMLACDFVTAPNVFVAQSLRESGIANDRIIETSYGFSPERLGPALTVERPKRPPIFAFVGLGIVRKGLDVLLEAWEKGSVNGSLLIAGLVSDELRSAYSNVLERPEVKDLGYVRDVASVYAAADVFVFPTHEEGGPLVAYEAAACGLASIVSPMGAGRILRHEVEALIVDPLDVDDLATAITSLAEDSDLRERLSVNAAARSKEFTWEMVGARFFEQISAVAPNGIMVAS